LAEVDAINFIQSRRLQLAAEASGVTVLLLCRRLPSQPGRQASAARTRWRIVSLPSGEAAPGGGVGRPCWRVELFHCRGGRPASWDVEWRDGALRERRLAQDAKPAPMAPRRRAAVAG
jgi:protein ImuA